MSKFVFTGIILQEEDGYSSLCIDLDIASQGDTPEEAKFNLIEAVTLYLESAIDSNLPFIRPVPEEENPLRTNPSRVLESFNINVDLEIYAYV